MNATLALVAFGLGWAYCAPPGPVFAEASRRGLRDGFRAALSVELGSLVGDAWWVALALAGASAVAHSETASGVLGLLGIALLCWLGIRALDAARRHAEPRPPARRHRRALGTGAAIALANPWALPFWLGVGGSLEQYGVRSPQAEDYAVFFVAFMVACTTYAFAVSAMLAWGRRWVTPRLLATIDIVCGMALLGFAVKLAVSLTGDLFG
jgi:chemosensory pili system protein ChpE